jgi:hypothetical protein
MQGRDRCRTAACEPDEHVRFGLRDPEVASSALDVNTDQVGGAF